ncbi:hypothetical protein N7492_002856 [Penicillium capsulatum]|uniref:Uncharacterized protein n=1 Tax=Penicillium capsulatum TaxID=69766 RepID=A0A9W9IM58_9EURO|nr:hypothetical protein N7492_002856 [Penicillium capsulatum]KAJ6122547.1 hypothetical protein N7512_005012 [Penicillium capsulatum]
MIPTPTLWMIYALALIFYLPLLSIAFATELARRDSTPSLGDVMGRNYPHYHLSETTDERCLAAPWHFGDNILYTERLNGFAVILIETTSGAVLCFIKGMELNRMMPKSIDDRAYEELYTDGFLGPQGHLMRAMRQLVHWNSGGLETSCIPVSKVLDVQMGAPGGQSKIKHYDVIRRMADDLKNRLKVNFEGWGSQADWRIPVYPIAASSAGTVAIWKTFEDPINVAKVWITGAYNAKGRTNEGDILAEITLFDSSEYPNQMNPQGELWSAFNSGGANYPVRGLLPLRQAPKPILQLHKETGAINTEHTKWMPYKAEDTYKGDEYTDCAQVSWSKDGSLLGFINTGDSPTFMIQTSDGSIVCQISSEKWEGVDDAWKSYYIKKYDDDQRQERLMEYEEARDKLFHELRSMLSGVKSAWGGQFWTYRGSMTKMFTELMKNVIGEMRRVIGDSTQSVPIKVFSTSSSNLQTAKKTGDYQFNAVWQPPPVTENAIVEEVWIWTMARQVPEESGGSGGPVGNKFPAARLDLLNKEKPYEYILKPLEI